MKNNDKVIEAYNRGYRVTETGEMYSPSGQKLNYDLHGSYSRFTFRWFGKKEHVNVHRLQAFQKFGLLLFEEGIVVRHLDGDSTNNNWDNIGIGTQSENMLDVPEAIRLARSIHAASFIKKYDVDNIRAYHLENGRSYKKTMANFEISSKGTLNYILKGKSVK